VLGKQKPSSSENSFWSDETISVCSWDRSQLRRKNEMRRKRLYKFLFETETSVGLGGVD
jgi:hypothetical protein